MTGPWPCPSAAGEGREMGCREGAWTEAAAWKRRRRGGAGEGAVDGEAARRGVETARAGELLCAGGHRRRERPRPAATWNPSRLCSFFFQVGAEWSFNLVRGEGVGQFCFLAVAFIVNNGSSRGTLI